MNSLNVMIEDLYYTTIEGKIADYYNMGIPDNSNIPVQISCSAFGSYYLICTKASGEFEIRITKQSDDKYWLFVSPIGKIDYEKM